MSYDPTTYLPGGPWLTMEYAARAFTTPKLFVESAAAPEAEVAPVAGVNMTPPSYFEFRRGAGSDQQLQISVFGSGSFSVLFQRSFDEGQSWQTVKTYTTNVEETYPLTTAAMYRLLVASGSGVSLRLRQDIQ
jgi:hypothetical protein